MPPPLNRNAKGKMNWGIGPLLTLTDRSDAYCRLVHIYLESSEDARVYIRKNWDFGVAWEYPNPARLACAIGERPSSEERIKAFLAYEGIAEKEKEDPRVVLIGYAIAYRSCILIGLDPTSLFRAVSKTMPPAVKTNMESFLARSDDDKSLSAFLLTEVTNADGEVEVRRMW